MTQQEARPRFESVPTAASDSPPKFAHPSEKEFAQILDFYGLRWSYEPYSFPLRWDGDAIAEMLTPDFYLHDLDLYLELTTMKQSLVTQKNRKIRRIREIYPDINIRLLYRKDFHRLLAKFGFGPLASLASRESTRFFYPTGKSSRRLTSSAKRCRKTTLKSSRSWSVCSEAWCASWRT